MQFAINTPNFGSFSDVRLMAELAHEAEDAGWDGLFVWDHIGGSSLQAIPMADPWVVLTAMAMTTGRIKLGPIVTPLPRRRPWKLARESVTLDHLSQGRLILGVGLGSDNFYKEYSTYGESPNGTVHGAMLDEGLDVLVQLWSGKTVSYAGQHYQLHDALCLPAPLQRPRIPIWIAGVWPLKKPFRRAASFDGVCPLKYADQLMQPDDIKEMLAYLRQFRTSDEPFDVLASGNTSGTGRQKDLDTIMPYVAAGATWWQESFAGSDSEELEAVRTRIRQGPPRLALKEEKRSLSMEE
jgi:alkanesulfonate monooxygenase SsuD/methylene tetrahydromethanopterin reductase-like flavin-dependent oxidoreductase (luciferase family)